MCSSGVECIGGIAKIGESKKKRARKTQGRDGMKMMMAVIEANSLFPLFLSTRRSYATL